jgi:hypothetical protein
MKRIAAMVIAATVLEHAGAQFAMSGLIPAQSADGQFIIRAPRGMELSPALAGLAANTNYILLEPALLAVSCERIKQKLWLDLGVNSPWRGRIYLNLHSAHSPDERVTLVSQKFTDGWSYRVEMPNLLSRDRFLRIIVQALLFEFSNRNSRDRTADIPAWLAEGLARQLRAAYERELFIRPPSKNVHGLTIDPEFVRDTHWTNPLERAQKQLRTRTPLTFEQLSWPADGQLEGEAGEVYRCNAQLLVAQLSGLKNGRANLCLLLATLPRYYSWQTAFLNAFRADFPNLLEVEKWWALQVVQFTGHELTQTWAMDESWRKLDETLQSSVDVRTDKNELPLHAEVNLQTVLREHDNARQIQLLQQKLRELDLLHLRVAREVTPTVDDYRRVIQNYLQKRTVSGSNSGRLTEETIRQLNVLDARREALHPALPTAVTSITVPVPAVAP